MRDAARTMAGAASRQSPPPTSRLRRLTCIISLRGNIHAFPAVKPFDSSLADRLTLWAGWTLGDFGARMRIGCGFLPSRSGIKGGRGVPSAPAARSILAHKRALQSSWPRPETSGQIARLKEVAVTARRAARARVTTRFRSCKSPKFRARTKDGDQRSCPITAFDRGCVKTPLLPENRRAQHDFWRSTLLWSLRMLENPAKSGTTSRLPEFSHRLPLRKFGSELSMTGIETKETCAEDRSWVRPHKTVRRPEDCNPRVGKPGLAA